MNRALSTIIALALVAGTAQADGGALTGNAALPGCKAFLTDAPLDLEQSYCAGVVQGLLHGMALSPIMCLPDALTGEQAMRVVIKRLEATPEVLHESFALLAGAALIAAFRCSESEPNQHKEAF